MTLNIHFFTANTHPPCPCGHLMSRTKQPTISHWLEYIAYRGFECALRMMSLKTTFKAGELMGRIFHQFSSTRRRQVTQNLRFAFGQELSQTEINELTAEIFERTGANFLSSLRVPFLNDEEILKHLTFEGVDHLLDTNKEHGIILVSPHMGNWELLAQAVFLTKGKISVGTHYRPLNNALINAVVERRRKKRGLKLFAKRTSTHQLTAFVREGNALGILADQRVGSRGAACAFFGRPTTCSPLPHLIAKRGKAKLFSLSCTTIGTSQWKTTFREIPEATAQACAESLEADWRRSPADVFWFEDRWRLRGKDALSFLKKYPEQNPVSRPLRAVFLGDIARDLPYPDSLISKETVLVDFCKDDQDLHEQLRKLGYSGASPVDVFICEKMYVGRMKKLAGKVLVLSSGDV